MSREQYTPPSLSQQPSTSNTGAGSSSQAGQSGDASYNSGGFNVTGVGYDDFSRPVHYLCGDCDAKVVLKKGDAIRCKECGYRVLYKERTNRMIQFEAR